MKPDGRGSNRAYRQFSTLFCAGGQRAMLSLKAIFFGLILPAIVCISNVAAAFLMPQSVGTKSRERLAAFAVTSGYIIGYLGIEGSLPLLPREGIHWLFYLAIAAFAIEGVLFLPARVRLFVHLALAVVIPRLILNAKFKYAWGNLEELIWWACLALAIFFFFTSVKSMEKDTTLLPTGAAQPFVFLGIAGGSALILALSGSMRLAQHAGVLVAMFAAIWIAMLLLPRFFGTDASLPDFFIPGAAYLLVGLWLNGYFYAEVPAASAVLLAVSPAMAWVSKGKSAPIQIACIALPVIVAMGIAVALSGLFGSNNGY